MTLVEIASPRYTIANNFRVENERETRVNNESGIKRFTGNNGHDSWLHTHQFASIENLRNRARVWRAEEVLEASKLLSEKGRLLVVGSPQSGKGTIIYGLTSICDLADEGYLFVDCHHQKKPAEEVTHAINQANKHNYPIFLDSADYLFARSRKIREIPKEVQRERTKQIIDCLSQVKSPLVMTMHNQFWMDVFVDHNMLEQYQDFLDTFPVYDLPRSMKSQESQTTYLLDHDFSAQETLQLINLPEDDTIRAISGAKAMADLKLALTDYAVLKSLAREKQLEVKSLLQEIRDGNLESAYKILQVIRESLYEVDFLVTLRSTK